jgi:hypothetical protein
VNEEGETGNAVPSRSFVNLKHHSKMKKEQLTAIENRLEELRKELREERISYGELIELQNLSNYIDENDIELKQAAGIPENTP